METICMKYQILFSGKNKKNLTNSLSAEYALRLEKLKKHDISIAEDNAF